MALCRGQPFPKMCSSAQLGSVFVLSACPDSGLARSSPLIGEDWEKPVSGPGFSPLFMPVPMLASLGPHVPLHALVSPGPYLQDLHHFRPRAGLQNHSQSQSHEGETGGFCACPGRLLGGGDCGPNKRMSRRGPAQGRAGGSKF